MPLEGIKKDFPWFNSPIRKKTVFLDSAATTHKPNTVLNTMKLLYEEYNAAVNRSSHEGGELFTEMYLGSHRAMARFIGGNDPREIVFTKNCTDSINIVATSLLRSKEDIFSIKPGDRIVTTIMEHHSNMVPWQELARSTGAEIVYAKITSDGTVDIDHLKTLLTERTRIAVFTHASNVLGTINPVKEMVHICREAGAITLVDGTQAVPHMPVNVADIGCDFYAFSGHKMLAPTGSGVLFGKRAILEKMAPASYGGGMIRDVTTDGSTWNDLPWKFEAGTPDACGAIALAGTDDPITGRHLHGAIDYLTEIGMDNIHAHEQELVGMAINSLREIECIQILGPNDPAVKTGIISFIITNKSKPVDCHAAGAMIGQEGISLRTGGHCAYPLIKHLGIDGTLRISFYIYNEMSDVKKLIRAVKNAIQFII